MGSPDRTGGAVPGMSRSAPSVVAEPRRTSPSGSAAFSSILFRDPRAFREVSGLCEPEVFSDLNLDQIVAAVTAGKEDYDLKPFFYLPLSDANDVVFRQEVMRDLEGPEVLRCIKNFAEAMQEVRRRRLEAERLHYAQQKQCWHLQAAKVYCDAVPRLAGELSCVRLSARGLLAFRDYLSRYLASERFTTLAEDTDRLDGRLSKIRYSVLIDGGDVQVRGYDGESDYGAQIEATFERFKQADVDGYAFEFADTRGMNHVEAMIVEQVARLYPEIFADLARFPQRHQGFVDDTIARFDREIQFYVAYLQFLAPLKKAGLEFCYPRVTKSSKEVFDDNGFDLALAVALAGEGAVPVRNDFHLNGGERMIVVSGPNQGGKTTFARTFGQLHYLACLGCPVPGKKAQLFLFDRLFTHFEREEDLASLHGKLEDDLVRIHEILSRATSNSIVVVNEMFNSTTSRDASALSKKIAWEISHRDLLCVWVTFLDELASLNEKTVSMVSTVDPDQPEQRTFKIVRRPADGLAFALSIARKYRLTYEQIGERSKS